ncbi:MAG: four helix bundle protein, partial [Spirosomaceae bacterium]|nr:four helix bundle protein [Spirosomataceae bacterium]
MATIKRFEDLVAWQKARDLDKMVFAITLKPEINRDFRLIDQWRGASGSVMDNIAEGFDRESTREFIQFLGYARGSCGEVQSQAYRALDRLYLAKDEFDKVYQYAQDTKNLIEGLRDYLKKTEHRGYRYKTPD